MAITRIINKEACKGDEIIVQAKWFRLIKVCTISQGGGGSNIDHIGRRDMFGMVPIRLRGRFLELQIRHGEKPSSHLQPTALVNFHQTTWHLITKPEVKMGECLG